MPWGCTINVMSTLLIARLFLTFSSVLCHSIPLFAWLWVEDCRCSGWPLLARNPHPRRLTQPIKASQTHLPLQSCHRGSACCCRYTVSTSLTSICRTLLCSYLWQLVCCLWNQNNKYCFFQLWEPTQYFTQYVNQQRGQLLHLFCCVSTAGDFNWEPP